MYSRIIFCLVFFTTLSCTGGLTDEQRQNLKKEMDAREIKKITEGEIMQAALQQSRQLQEKAEAIFGPVPDQEELLKSGDFEQRESLKLRWVTNADEIVSEKEKLIFDAYTFGYQENKLSDNIQKLGTDSLLYTKPVVLNENGAMLFKGMWCLTTARKDIIRRM